jgi:hypothetical membrane protein
VKKIRAWLRKYADDLLFVAGFVAILIGVYQLNPLACWFVAGVEFLVAGTIVAWSKRK